VSGVGHAHPLQRVGFIALSAQFARSVAGVMATADIVIVDYGMANLRSVQKAFERVGFAADVSSDPQRVADAAKVVLPGVGAFRDAIARLRETGLADTITEHVRDGQPFLGICLGLQLVFTRSHEDGLHAGLDLFPGEVVRFPEVPGLKVPHMGWNPLRLTRPDCPLFADLPPDPAVYFVHSYYPVPVDRGIVAAEADYPDPFCAVIWKENVFATQFHPEKSQEVGLTMLRNFARL
jgi:glutamine amidotransferase